VGEQDKGWTYAKFLLGHERTNIAGVAESKRLLQKLKTIAARTRVCDQPLSADPRFRDRLAQIELELLALEITNLRLLCDDTKGAAPGPQASLLKIRGSEVQQNLAELSMQALGPYALAYLHEALDPQWEPDSILAQFLPDYAPALSGQYFNLRKTSIYGGSNEIQKNIMAQMILGL
jgi:alkylation response protein AidB-like acyl-CoA dehydrogenase